MTLSRRRFLSITAGTSLGAFGILPNTAFSQTTSWRGLVLGAEARLVIAGLPKSEANRLITLARQEIERLENIFSIYRQNSLLSNLNRTGKLDYPPSELLSLSSKVDLIHSASQGLFDPTIQPLWKIYAENKGKPSSFQIQEARKLVGWQQVFTDASAVKYHEAGMAMTLNGIAQGFITDRITQLLKAQGLSKAVVKLGEISAIGSNPDNRPWQIGIAQLGDGAAEESITLTDQSVATSSPVATMFDGQSSHIINPGNGLPARPTWNRISVIHKSATIADGLSTAAILMDQTQIIKMLDKIGSTRVIAEDTSGKRFQYQS